MELTLQYFDGCPNWKIAERRLATLIQQQGLEVEIRYQLIDSPEAAAEHGFRGSPTILVNGSDPFAAPDAPVGLSCRVYPTDDGPAGSPTLQQLAEAMQAASG